MSTLEQRVKGREAEINAFIENVCTTMGSFGITELKITIKDDKGVFEMKSKNSKPKKSDQTYGCCDQKKEDRDEREDESDEEGFDRHYFRP